MIAATTTVVVVALAAWWLSTPRVELDERGYDMTLALYRVCNQKDLQSLAELERMLDSLPNESQAAISTIIESAKEGRWEEAGIACRIALEDQVQR